MNFFFFCNFFFHFLLLRSHGIHHDYVNALSKSILFFEGQRSGPLPPDQRLDWRQDSALTDGSELGLDLSGGYYDAGDNVKFVFPMAFTTTMLAWSLLEFGHLMPSAELRRALVAVRWAADFLLKAVSSPDRIVVQIGDPTIDHGCWERPEDMDTARTIYVIEAPNPASDVAGEIAAALAASSLAFRQSDPGYSETLLRNGVKVFEFADTYRGAYSDNPHIRTGACPFYCDFSGFDDELLWAATWLGIATNSDSYLDYILHNGKTMGVGENINEFGWDDKHAGINVLLSKEFVERNKSNFEVFKESTDSFICSILSGTGVQYTTGGLMYRSGGSNLQHAAAIAFLMLAHAAALERTARPMSCSGATVEAAELQRRARVQVDYILGDNPANMSFMVGYGGSYPKRIHHRASSLPSMKDHPKFISCKGGSVYYNSTGPNPNLLEGAVVGGPGSDDIYLDERWDFVKSEPATYINAPLVGALAYFSANFY